MNTTVYYHKVDLDGNASAAIARQALNSQCKLVRVSGDCVIKN
jgi:oligoribonuclease NrnB/cAMP/cGMP phosphodiesterase (DHH superfamily)